jgi:hypothetical protein
MVAVQVADENVVDPVELDAITVQLDQRSFPAIHQKKPLMDVDHLSGRMSLVNRGSGTATENGKLETHQ